MFVVLSTTNIKRLSFALSAPLRLNNFLNELSTSTGFVQPPSGKVSFNTQAVDIINKLPQSPVVTPIKIQNQPW